MPHAPRSPRLLIARALSIVGHPALLVPVAVAAAVARMGLSREGLWIALVTPLVLATCVVVYGLVQVRAGRWGNVDASVPSERAELTTFLLPLLAGGTVLLWGLGQPAAAVAALGLGAAMVAVAHATRRRLKLSLHAAFAVHAAALVGAWPVLSLPCLALAGGVAWSRVVLGRHTVREVLLGLALGAAAGAGFVAVVLNAA